MDRLRKLFAEMMGLIYERELRIVREFDLSLLEYYALQILGFAQEASLKEIGQRLALPKSTVTFVADSLARRGFVERRQDKQDRRIWRLHLTEEGLDLMGKIFARKSRFLLPVFDNLSDVESQVLQRVMEGVTEQLRASR